MKSTFLTALFVIGASTLILAIPDNAAAGSAAVSAPADEEMAALKKKFEQRFPKIVELKSAGTVGETSDGYLDWVKGESKDAAPLVDDENADRRKLYDLIAKKEGTEPGTVAQRNAQRNFEKARKGDYLKKDGTWVQK